MTIERPSRIRFAPFELDLVAGELRRNGAPVHLAPQPMAALRLLVARPGGLVTREELRQAVWGPQHHLDFNAGLNFCVGQLRTALADPASESRFIQAIPKRGYRFVAPVETLVPTVAAKMVAATVEAPAGSTRRPSARRSHLLWLPSGGALAALVVSLMSPGSPSRQERPRTTSVAAAKALIRASAGLADAGPDELLRRIRVLDTAIDADRAFAEAYAGKAHALLLAGLYRAQTPAAAFADAAAHAARAIDLAPGLASAHAAYGAALLYSQWDWRGAGRHLERAIALDPFSSAAHQWYSRYLSARGQHRDAVIEARRAVHLAPSSASALTDLGWAFFYAGRFADAVTACDDAAQLLPAFAPARRCAGAAAAESGDYQGAMSRAAALSRQSGAAPALVSALTSPAAWSSADAFWRGRLLRIEAAVTSSSCGCDDALLAVPLAHLGRTDLAFTALERGADQASDVVLTAASHPAFARMRLEHRFGYLLRRLGLN